MGADVTESFGHKTYHRAAGCGKCRIIDVFGEFAKKLKEHKASGNE